MATLSQAKVQTKKALILFGLSIVGLIFLTILFNVGVSIKQNFFPAPPPPAAAAFGKLPQIPFPPNTIKIDFSYTINTVSGFLPTLADRANVYKMLVPQPDLLALQRAEQKAAEMDYTDTPVSLSSTLYQWYSQKNLPQTLTMDIITNNFKITSNFYQDSTVIAADKLPDETRAISMLKDFLSRGEAFSADIDETKSKVTFWNIVGNTLIPASSLSRAQVLRVDLFLKDFNNLPVLYPIPTYSIINAFIGSGPDVAGQSSPEILAAEFAHQNIQEENNSSYGVKTTAQAFEDLKNGNAYFASSTPGEKKVIIKSVYLAYFHKQPNNILCP